MENQLDIKNNRNQSKLNFSSLIFESDKSIPYNENIQQPALGGKKWSKTPCVYNSGCDKKAMFKTNDVPFNANTNTNKIYPDLFNLNKNPKNKFSVFNIGGDSKSNSFNTKQPLNGNGKNSKKKSRKFNMDLVYEANEEEDKSSIINKKQSHNIFNTNNTQTINRKLEFNNDYNTIINNNHDIIENELG